MNPAVIGLVGVTTLRADRLTRTGFGTAVTWNETVALPAAEYARLPPWLAWIVTVPAAPVRVTVFPLTVAGPLRTV
jgi:hypothetical protein